MCNTGDVNRAAEADLDGLIDDLARRLSNWGRWGDEDSRGTLNFIQPAKRAEAAACVRTGQTVSLAMPLQSAWPQVVGSGRINAQHMMVKTGTEVLAAGERYGFSDDVVTMSVHAHTHWDAVAHAFHRGVMFNGVSAGLVTAAGASRNDIMAVANTMVTRGVLLDLVPQGAVALGTGEEIKVADLESALERERVDLGDGDVLLIRTGHLGRVRRENRWTEFSQVNGVNPSEPGIGWSCLPWLHERRVAAVACDNWAVEVLRGAATTCLPVHMVGLAHMGLPLGEMFDLDHLAALSAADGNWDFLLAAAPLPIEGAVGGAVNPMAIR